MTMPLPTPEVQRAADRKAFAVRKEGYVREALHAWCDKDGEVAFWRLRYRNPTTGEKWIRPMYIKDSQFTVGEPEAPSTGKLLYRLPELHAADSTQPVWIVEGEKCVDKLAELGMIATTSGGAGSADAANWTALSGRQCILWPDDDEPGSDYADAVITKLRALDCQMKRIDVTALDLPENGDCVDWLGQHPSATAADLLALPMLEVGDSGDDGDAAPHKGSGSPQGQAQDGDSGDNPAPHFELRENGPTPGVYWCGVVVDKKTGAIIGEAAPQFICSPLKVAAATRDPQNGSWGRLLIFNDRDGKEHRWTMPMKMLAGDGEELRAVLLSEGLVITSHQNRRMLADYIQRQAPEVTARCVDRTGWHGDVYALPRETFGDTENEPVLFQAASLDGLTLGQGGTFEGWREQVAMRCAGNSRLVLSVAAAFAGPCLGLSQLEGGGLQLRGSSSTGKTTALLVAASVFGSPAYARAWRTTDNALEGVAALHSDLLLILDEIGQLDPKHAGQVAYLLANGQGKGRAHRDGSPRASATWRVLFLSAGEVGLSDLVMQAGGRVRAGQDVRVIDLPADAGVGQGLFEQVPAGMTPSMFADALKTASAKHYGHALPAFLKCLVSDPAKAREYLRSRREAMSVRLAAVGADGQVRRVADRFALVAAAGELATDCGLTGWRAGEAEDAARKCFDAWLAARGTAGAGEPQAMIAQVRTFLELHGESRFTFWDDMLQTKRGDDDDNVPFVSRTINRAGFWRASPDGPTYFIEREVFKSQVCAGFDHAAVARTLIEVGAMEKAGDGRFDHKIRLPDGRSPRVYIIKPAFWDVGDVPAVPSGQGAGGEAAGVAAQRVPTFPTVPAQNDVAGRKVAPKPPKGGRHA
ncbi:MAG TPA: DUF927 domain-containing protein [Rhodanobacter sp.]|nr:DUF927 domain-containing protein [Rhodanobacter sp.]